jgi:plastocyanin
MRIRRIITLVAVLAVTMGFLASAALGVTKNVGVKKSGSKWLFTPSALTIKKGDSVKWSWSGKAPHNVSGPGFTSTTATKATYKRRFNKKGTFRVVCTIHAKKGQKMTVKVT